MRCDVIGAVLFRASNQCILAIGATRVSTTLNLYLVR